MNIPFDAVLLAADRGVMDSLRPRLGKAPCEISVTRSQLAIERRWSDDRALSSAGDRQKQL